MTATVPIRWTVYHAGSDVTPWVTAVEVVQPSQTIYREFGVTLVGWSSFEAGGTWDVFGSYEPENPRAECLIRGGVVPPDRQVSMGLQTGAVPQVTIRGYDRVWLALRRAPRETVVLAPDSDGAAVARVLEDYGGVVGRYRVWRGMRTLHNAVVALGNAAGLRVRCLVPNYPLQPLVVDPRSSYWQAMLGLLEPVGAEVWYRRTANELVVADPLSLRYGLGRRMTIPAGLVVRAEAIPWRRRRVRRVVFRVPPCR